MCGSRVFLCYSGFRFLFHAHRGPRLSFRVCFLPSKLYRLNWRTIGKDAVAGLVFHLWVFATGAGGKGVGDGGRYVFMMPCSKRRYEQCTGSLEGSPEGSREASSFLFSGQLFDLLSFSIYIALLEGVLDFAFRSV